MTDFTSSDDIINVSDICDRVEELRSERDDLQTAVEEAETNQAEDSTEEHTDDHYEAVENAKKEAAEWEGENDEELETLESLLSDICGYGGDHQWGGDWYPATLINENYFETAMDEMLEDIGDIPKDLPSYLTITVDYDALKQDYSEVEFDGTTYYYR